MTVARYSLAFIVALAAWLSAADAIAAEPLVTRVSPAGLTAGQTRQITILGRRLADITDVLFYDSGLRLEKIEAVSDKEVKLTIVADAGLPGDLHPFRLLAKTGLSNLRYLGVSPLESLDETEPNDDFANPQLVPLDRTIDGTVRREDVDYFAVDLKAGQTVHLELEGLRHSYDRNEFDPSLTVWNTERFQVAASDDASLVRLDCEAAFVAPADGRFIVEVREAVYGGSDDSLYRLHVSSQTRPVVMVPAGGEPGGKLVAKLIDSLGNHWQESFELPAEPARGYPLWSGHEDRRPASPNRVMVKKAAHFTESEPNNNREQNNALESLPIIVYGQLEAAGDEDYFRFTAKKNQKIQIRSLSRNQLRSPIDTSLAIHKLAGGYVAGNDDTQGPDSFIDFKPPEDGEYVLQVRDHLARGGADFAYAIEFAPPAPSLTTTVAEWRRLFENNLVVPRGGRYALDIDITRENVGGDVVIELQNLPQGVTAPPVTVPADQRSAAVMVYAAADAPLATSLTGVSAKITPENGEPIHGTFNQRIQLIRGQNNRDVWGYDSPAVATAIVEECPFDITVEQPKVPLVRDGLLNLPVKLTRKGDFKGVVRVKLLENPPGISSRYSTDIPADASGVDIALNANGNAAIGAWPIVIIAWADVGGGGEFRIASEPVKLDVADRVFEINFQKTMATRGQSVTVDVPLKLKSELEGTVEIELLGLPPKVTCDEAKKTIARDAANVQFTLKIPEDAPLGSFKTLACRGTITSDAGVVTQTRSGGEVQIDAPLEVKAEAPKVAEATPEPAAKPLSRLEQLRAARMQNKPQ